MKRIIALLLAALMLLSFVSCGEKYPPVESTDEESRVVMTLTVGDRSYDVRYELYRALFLANKKTVDGGDNSVWSGDNKAEYVERISEIIYGRISDIYSCFYVAESIGEDIYSSDYENKIKEQIRINVEGSDYITGHGSYEKYLESLKENYMNYSVSVLMMRYAFALDRINEYYYGREDGVLGEEDGNLEYTEDDVREFYFGDDCVRFLKAYLQEGVRTPSEMQQFRAAMAEKVGDTDVALYIIGNTSVTASELITTDGRITGTVLGRSALDSIYYSEYTAEAFRIGVGEVSEIITVSGVSDGYSDGYYVFYGLEKDDEHLERCYAEIEAAYKSHTIGKIIDRAKSALLSSLKLTEDGKAIDHASISMEP